MDDEIRETIRSLLKDDPWRLITPVQVYHEMGKRGRCCGCFPGLVDLILETTEHYHLEMTSDRSTVISFINKLKKEHEQCETARILAQRKKAAIKVA